MLGSWKHRNNPPVPLNWSRESITVLGCRLGNDVSVDWDSLIVKFGDQLNLWKSCQLSFHGHALIANVLGLSVFWYHATVFDVPKTVIAKINKTLFPFVWSKKREWMARSSVTQSLAAGGLGVVDVSRKIASLSTIWLRRFLSAANPHLWTCFFQYHVSMVFTNQDVTSVLARGSISTYLVKKLPLLYALIVRMWVDVKGMRDGRLWVIPRPSIDPLSIGELSAHSGYSLVSQYQHVNHRSLAKFRDWGFTVDWKRVWASLHLWKFVRSVQDTAWLSFHGILPTADRLVRFKMNVNPSCFCGQPETFIHLFTTCLLARDIFNLV